MDTQPGLFEEMENPVIPATIGSARIGIREKSNVLSKASAEYLNVDYTLNPYVGCGFGCSYCYAAFYVPDDRQRQDWGRWVDVKVDAERQIAKTDLRGKRIFMSSATDPYQPIEAKIELTRRVVELMADQQAWLIVQTRSPIAARDIDLFKRFDSIRVNMSITTDSDDIRKRFEPMCASIDRRIEAISRIASAGIQVGISISPTLPMHDPEAFAKRLAIIKPSAVYSAYFHMAKKDFQANTRSIALDLAKEYGWNEVEYRKSIDSMRKHLPQLRSPAQPR